MLGFFTFDNNCKKKILLLYQCVLNSIKTSSSVPIVYSSVHIGSSNQSLGYVHWWDEIKECPRSYIRNYDGLLSFPV